MTKKLPKKLKKIGAREEDKTTKKNERKVKAKREEMGKENRMSEKEKVISEE